MRKRKKEENGTFVAGLPPEGAYAVALSREVISTPFEVKAGHETGPVELVMGK